jgi:hypothetical protein
MVPGQREHAARLQHFALRQIGLLAHAASHGAAEDGDRLEARMRVRRHDVVGRELDAQDEQPGFCRVAVQKHGLRAFGKRRVILKSDRFRCEFLGAARVR